ncbi:MAG: HNH endonuclease [Burkholderiales bacterium]|nr:HNH endonuclease [Anaerolineae bacterium]
MTYIPEAMRRSVLERAQNCCEYCLLTVNTTAFPHEVDHIIAEKHSGKTDIDNLCLSCFECNRHKGSDVASYDPETGEGEFLFNPRLHQWPDHFRLDQARIEALTRRGRVTAFLLQFNREDRLLERQTLIEVNRYPCKPLAL